jgi:hypothetical protein
MNLKPDEWTKSGDSGSAGPQLSVTQAAFLLDSTR